MANRCAAAETAPVSEKAGRRVVSPIALAIASEHPTPDLAASVNLGGAQEGHTALYVRFDPRAYTGTLEAGFLLLDPESHSAFAEDVELEVGRAARSWQGSSFFWSDQPGFASPVTRGIARTQPPSPIRVDVTEIVRFLAARPSSDHGFVVRASDQHALGVSIATGTDSGNPPRLDVYLTR